jgi:putative cell wall-binding protein
MRSFLTGSVSRRRLRLLPTLMVVLLLASEAPAVAAEVREAYLPAGTRVVGEFDQNHWADYWYFRAYAGQQLTFNLGSAAVGNCLLTLWKSAAPATFLSEGSRRITYTIPAGIAGERYDIDVEAYPSYSRSYAMSYWMTDPPVDRPITRTFGPDRYATAIATSRTRASADTVVLCTGARFADALCASGLAGSYDAPILLTRSDVLSPGIAAEIERLGASTVYILGSTAAVSSTVFDAVAALPGITAERIGGDDRYATAALVSERVRSHEGTGFGKRAFVVNGAGFADAMSVSPLAYSQRMPILLVRASEVPTNTAEEIADGGIDDVHLIGSGSAVSTATYEALAVTTKARVSGADRYATSAAVADHAASHGWTAFSRIGLATGEDFPDALGGGAWVGAGAGIMLLTRHDYLPTASSRVLQAHRNAAALKVFGGGGVVFGSVIGDANLAMR